MDLYLDGIDADGRLSAKTRFDYRHSTDDYIRPHLGTRRVRDVTAEVVLAWQRKLTQGGGTKAGRGLSPNTIRLARAPLAGAFKLAVAAGMVAVNPLIGAPRPRPRRSIPKHWSPEQAREFLALMEGDRTWPVWAFLLGSGLRVGELVWLRWGSVDFDRRLVRVVDFVSTLGHDLVASTGKSRDSVRTIDLDDGLVKVLRAQRALQAEERLSASSWVESDLRVHQAGRRSLPSPAPLPDARYLLQRAWPSSSHRSRAAPYERHVDAGQRGVTQGGRGAARPCRPHIVHKSLQPRDTDHATRRGRPDRCCPVRSPGIGLTNFGDARRSPLSGRPAPGSDPPTTG